MICTNSNCNKRKYCEKTHELENVEFNKKGDIIIPYMFFFELNGSNRLAKSADLSKGFKFGCFKMAGDEVRGYTLNWNNTPVAGYTYEKLLDTCTNAFIEMVSLGLVKLG